VASRCVAREPRCPTTRRRRSRRDGCCRVRGTRVLWISSAVRSRLRRIAIPWRALSAYHPWPLGDPPPKDIREGARGPSVLAEGSCPRPSPAASGRAECAC
jgi:hypothetical protein